MAGKTRNITTAAPASEPATEVTAGASFGLCEGTRQEVEVHGKAVDPFTGRVVTREDVK